MFMMQRKDSTPNFESSNHASPARRVSTIMDLDANTDELEKRFPEIEGKIDILAECQSVMRLFSIDATELYYKWESYCLKTESPDLKMNLDTIRAFKMDLQMQLERESRHPKRHQNQNEAIYSRPSSSPSAIQDLLEGMMPGTPKLQSNLKRKLNMNSETPIIKTPRSTSLSIATPTANGALCSSPLFESYERTGEKLLTMRNSSSSLNDRPDADKILETLNPEIELRTSNIPGSMERTQFTLNMDIKKFSFPTMRQKLSETSEG